jgi:hypothetical protein
MSVWLVGPLYDDCCEEADQIPIPVGLTDLWIGSVMDAHVDGEPTFYEIDQIRERIGWAPASSLKPKSSARIDLGSKVFVKN